VEEKRFEKERKITIRKLESKKSGLIDIKNQADANDSINHLESDEA